MKNIAVLLTVHNRKEKTLECLRNLFNSIEIIKKEGLFNFNIYLTDDGSTDGTAAAVKLNYPDVVLLPGDGTLFWNRGMINSWKEAAKKDCDFYLWLNDDTNLNKNSLEVLLKYASKNVDDIFVGATQSHHTLAMTYTGERNYKRLIPNGKLQLCDTFNGNFVLIPRSAFKKIGYLDNRYSHSLGDYDYGWMATKKNIKIYLLPEFIGFCEEHVSKLICFDKNNDIRKRLKHLYSPLGCDPREFLIYDIKHKGIISALKHFISINLKAIFP